MKVYNFTSKFKVSIVIPIAILVAGVITGFAMGGLNVGIDFSGGSLTTIEIGQDYDVDVINEVLNENGVGDSPVVKSGDSYTAAIIRMRDLGDEDLNTDKVDEVLAGIQETYPDAAIDGIDRVGGTASAELVRNAFLAILVACGLMLVYIWIRFELYSGIAAVITLAMDVGVMIAVVCMFRLPVNSGFIAACLTIVGYSINNTIVIFDRIRDNKKVMGLKNYTRAELANTSITQTLSRTINTSVTTLIMIVCLYIFGVESIKEFSLPIIVGLLAGTYSSVFLSAPIWSKLSDKFEDRSKTKKKPASNKKKKAKAAKA